MPKHPAEAVRLPAVRPLERLSVIDRAELELRNALFTGELRSGDPLPEVHVAAAMGISRSSLREACQRLVRDGLLDQHPGRGLFVTTFDPQASADFLEYRLAIEMQIVTLLAERVARSRARAGDAARQESPAAAHGGPTGGQRLDAPTSARSEPPPEAAVGSDLLAPLRRCLRRIEQGLEAERPIEAGNADLDLHLALAEASGNPYLRTSMSTIVLLTRMQAIADPRGYGVHEGLLADHLGLLGALENGDAHAARRALSTMLRTVAQQTFDEHGKDVLRDPTLRDRQDHDFQPLPEQ